MFVPSRWICVVICWMKHTISHVIEEGGRIQKFWFWNTLFAWEGGIKFLRLEWLLSDFTLKQNIKKSIISRVKLNNIESNWYKAYSNMTSSDLALLIRKVPWLWIKTSKNRLYLEKSWKILSLIDKKLTQIWRRQI